MSEVTNFVLSRKLILNSLDECIWSLWWGFLTVEVTIGHLSSCQTVVYRTDSSHVAPHQCNIWCYTILQCINMMHSAMKFEDAEALVSVGFSVVVVVVVAVAVAVLLHYWLEVRKHSIYCKCFACGPAAVSATASLAS